MTTETRAGFERRSRNWSLLRHEVKLRQPPAVSATKCDGRLSTVNEVAAAALWLWGPGSQSVNGQAIQISGGQM